VQHVKVCVCARIKDLGARLGQERVQRVKVRHREGERERERNRQAGRQTEGREQERVQRVKVCARAHVCVCVRASRTWRHGWGRSACSA
jgi:hypothetical protein